MDGYLAPLDEICDLAERYDAMVMVDDSHAVGFVGPTGRGTPELHGVADRVDIVTGTLGKALGGATGGYTSGRAEIVDLLRQRSRPYLFSNSVAPPWSAPRSRCSTCSRPATTCAAGCARTPRWFRARMTDARLRRAARRAPDRAGDDRRRGAGQPRWPTRCWARAST